MAIWPFNRNQNQSEDIPQEVQDYYQAEKREKVGIAGLLALGTLLVTIILSMGLFFGGRWVYRTVFDDNKAPQTAQQQAADDNDKEAEEANNQPAPSAAPSTPTTPSTPTQTPGSTTPRNTASTTPRTALPDTGPADTAIIALSTVMFATAGYYVFGGKKTFNS